MGKLR